VFNVGGGEILVILVIALIVLGPERLPGAARQVGKALAQFRQMSSGVERDIREALDTDELREGVATLKQVTNLRQTVRSEIASAASSLTSPINTAKNDFSLKSAVASGSRHNGGSGSGSASPDSSGRGVDVAPPDGLYADDLPTPSASGAQIPVPTMAIRDVLADRPAPIIADPSAIPAPQPGAVLAQPAQPVQPSSQPSSAPAAPSAPSAPSALPEWP
jgi:sec-independent protein translocase protein TatB